ncbi:MAG TPA: response regulator [Anaerolineales bacterium]|jgi:DNA-binding response OmpR family regulator|nr:response regulator [Anaerolineales bacterium]
MTKILLVDDDPITKTLLQTLLEMEGFRVIPWELGTNVLETMHVVQPDIVVMDVNLNGLDGIEVLRDLRAAQEFQDVRVIMSSGMNYREECEREGANDFLLKPYMPDDLIATIRKNLS